MPTTEKPATETTPMVVDEHAAAKALGVSVFTLRKDRTKGKRFPFYRIGGTIRYDLNRLREVLAQYEEGGPGGPRRRVRPVGAA